MAPRKKKPLPPATGDCYEAAGKYLMDHKEVEGIFLVHGEVEGQGPLAGIRFGHAWIEQGEECIEVSMGRFEVLPKFLYYALGQIHGHFPPWEPNIHRYTPEEAVKKILKYKHWGPWDLVTSTGR